MEQKTIEQKIREEAINSFLQELRTAAEGSGMDASRLRIRLLALQDFCKAFLK